MPALHTPVPKPLTLAVRIAFAATLALTLNPPAHAQTAPAAVVKYDIPAAPLAEALTLYSQQAGVAIVMDASQLRGLRAPALQGSYAVEEGFAILLRGSGYSVARTAVGYVLRPAGASATPPATAATPAAPADAMLGAVTVTAEAESDGRTEGSGRYTTNGPSRTATGLNMTLKETPQAVSIVTQQQMQDQHMRSLDDVADGATGLTYSKLGTERSYFYSRGNAVTDLQIDGMSTSLAESFSTDVLSLNNMAIYDRVEIVRGANGLLQGSGNPSAVINLVRKRPTREFQFSAEAGAASWADYTGQLDVSGSLNQSGSVRGRAVLYGNHANSYRNGAGTNNKLLYLIGEADLDPATTVSFGLTAQKDDHRGYDWGGLPIKADGSFYDLPRSTSLAGPWAHLNRNNYSIFGDLTHYFANGWTVSAAANGIRSKADYLASISTRVSGDTFLLSTSNTLYNDRQWSLNLKANGNFTLFGREHELIIGASNRKDNLYYPYYSATSTSTIDINDPNFWPIPQPAINYASNLNVSYRRSEKGLFAATRLHATDALSVILGTRLSWADYAVKTTYVNSRYDSGRQPVPYAGLVYQLTPQHSLYTSYTNIFSVQQSFGPNGLLDPLKGRNYEGGVKSTLFGGLNTAVAAFQTDQVNLPVALDMPATCGAAGNSNCYTAGAKVRTRGVELEASGSPVTGLNLAAGYTYANPSYEEGPNSGKQYNTAIPRRVLKLSGDYTLPGGQWRVGGKLQSQSRMYYQYTGYKVSEGGYSVLDLHANYRYSRHLSVQLNIRNATDKHYYQTIPPTTYFRGLLYGAPRSFAATVRYDY